MRNQELKIIVEEEISKKNKKQYQSKVGIKVAAFIELILKTIQHLSIILAIYLKMNHQNNQVLRRKETSILLKIKKMMERNMFVENVKQAKALI